MRYRQFRYLSYLIIVVPFVAIVVQFTKQVGLYNGLQSAWGRQAMFFIPLVLALLSFFLWDIIKYRRAKQKLKERIYAKKAASSTVEHSREH